MKMTGNTILITGGGSGIGLELAKEFKKRGNQVLVAGRSKEKLKHAQEFGLMPYEVDMTSASSIQSFAAKVTQEYPALNVVIQNAGVMKSELLTKGKNAAIQDETVATNFLGPIRLTEALLPTLLKQSESTLMTVSSGLAFVPLALNATYCATKAAIHSYTQSLRYQLEGTPVKVVELVPPYVRTHLTGDRQAQDPNAMPLEDFISEVMTLIEKNPNAKEICVQRVHPQRYAAAKETTAYDEFYKKFNDMMVGARRHEIGF